MEANEIKQNIGYMIKLKKSQIKLLGDNYGTLKEELETLEGALLLITGRDKVLISSLKHPLNNRIMNCLDSVGIRYTEQLKDTSNAELMKIPKLGKRSFVLLVDFRNNLSKYL